MRRDYIPAADIEALAWMQAFSWTLARAPSAYFVGPADVSHINRVVLEFEAAFQVASEVSTRTQVTVRAKDHSRADAEGLCRQYAGQIKLNAGISDAAKIAAGVRPVNRDRVPIRCPASVPLLGIVSAHSGQQTLRYRDSETPTSGAKPFGAWQLQLFVALGEKPITDVAEARAWGFYTRNPVVAKFEHAHDGRVATHFARWCGRRGDVGPWCAPVSMRVAA